MSSDAGSIPAASTMDFHDVENTLGRPGRRRRCGLFGLRRPRRHGPIEVRLEAGRHGLPRIQPDDPVRLFPAGLYH